MIRSQPGYGSLGVGGALGFAALMTGDKVMLPPRVAFGESLSAHASSEVVLELAAPTSVRGALNASACLHDGGACEFWIDDHWIGDLTAPCQTTHALHLPAGTYRLRSRTTRKSWGAHSIWLFAESPARHSRVALFTVACYPEDRVKDTVRWLYSSAAKVGWLVHAFGVATPVENYKSPGATHRAGPQRVPLHVAADGEEMLVGLCRERLEATPSMQRHRASLGDAWYHPGRDGAKASRDQGSNGTRGPGGLGGDGRWPVTFTAMEVARET